jgi:hypothetical protein
VRVPEGHAVPDELLGPVGGVERGIGGRGGEPLAVELEPADQHAERRERAADVAPRREDRLLVLLEVAVVGERQPLDDREQPGEAADRRARLAARELGDVGFSFCGIVEEPVAASSGRRAKPNSALVQSTSSSPIRERCVQRRAAA